MNQSAFSSRWTLGAPAKPVRAGRARTVGRSRAGALLLAAISASPELVSADTALGVLAVAPPPGPTVEVMEVTTQLRHALADRLPGVLPPARLAERMTARLEGAALAEVDQVLARAREARVRGDYEGSERELRALASKLETLPQDEEVLRRWAEAMMQIAKSELDFGRTEAAQATLDELVRAIPDVEVDRIQYPPSFERKVEEARARVAALPMRALSITSSVPGARIFVGSRQFKATAVTVPLPAGRYRVSAEHGSERVSLAPVDLTLGPASVTIDFAQARSFRPEKEPGLALPAGDRARRILDAGARLRLDLVVAVSLASEPDGRSHVVAGMYDVRRGQLLREARVSLIQRALPLGSLPGLAEYLATGRSSAKIVEITFPPPVVAPPKQPEPPKASRLAPDGRKLVPARMRIAAELRDPSSGYFVKYVDAGEEVMAAEAPARGSRWVLLSDGLSGSVPAGAVEDASDAAKRRRLEERRREEQEKASRRAEARRRDVARGGEAGKGGSGRSPPPASLLDSVPNARELAAGRMRQAAELRDRPNGVFVAFVDRGTEVWTGQETSGGYRLIVLESGLSGYVRAGTVEVLGAPSASPRR